MTLSRRDLLSTAAAGVVAGAFSTRLPLLADEVSSAEPTANPFLTGNFAPVREEITVENLKVMGKLPRDLNGMFVRNGPNPQFPPILNYHWFEGDGMLHGIHIRDGKASYRNRWVRTAAWHEERAAGRALYPSVLDPPNPKLFLKHMLAGKLPYPNRANTALLAHHGKLLALWEAGPPHEIRVPSLETVGPYDFGGRLAHAFTAHPKVDPRTGELIFFGYWPFQPYLQYSVADREGKIVSTTPIELPRPIMIHDVAITTNYTLFIDAPAVFDALAPVRGKEILRWEPQHGARVGILPRHATGDQIKWFEIETCFVFHLFNAHEEGDEIVLHVCRFPEFPSFVAFDGSVTGANAEERANAMQPIAYRWRFNLKTGQVSETALDDLTSEFPRIDERLTGSPARFGYAVTGPAKTSGLLKYDFQQGTRELHELTQSQFAGEALFVPRPDSNGDDDGYLVSLIHDMAEEQSKLLVLDCRDFTSPPVARVLMPQRVPYGFHAIWLPDAA